MLILGTSKSWQDTNISLTNLQLIYSFYNSLLLDKPLYFIVPNIIAVALYYSVMIHLQYLWTHVLVNVGDKKVKKEEDVAFLITCSLWTSTLHFSSNTLQPWLYTVEQRRQQSWKVTTF